MVNPVLCSLCLLLVLLCGSHHGAEGKHYTIIPKKTNWYEGAGRCLAMGGQIASIRDSREQVQLKEQVPEFLSELTSFDFH